MIHFLHIDRTGGLAIKTALQGQSGFILHPPETRLRDIPAGEKVLFAIRHPVSRFISGFNSRLRKGKPQPERDWTEGEENAFEVFKTPDAVAQAINNADSDLHESAFSAMWEIDHVKTRLSQWFASDELRARRADLVGILWHGGLTADFNRLRRTAAFGEAAPLPTDEREANKAPAGGETELSVQGEKNIKRWYREDIVLYRECLAIRKELVGA